ncbi:MAG: threonyl-tRNA synthetase editing domain-containing protein [Promethearchaeati archaeon]
MRFLSFHCEYFRYQTTDRSRSNVFEELTAKNKEGSLENVLVLFISIEKSDQTDTNFLKRSEKEIESLISQLKVSNIVLLSFAHLFAELSTPKFALNALRKLEDLLINRGYEILRPPFGWFNELEMKAKGHPLSRISRRI